jgi:CHAD domain-containing protein
MKSDVANSFWIAARTDARQLSEVLLRMHGEGFIDAEDIHHARVLTRRLRAAIRSLSEVFGAQHFVVSSSDLEFAVAGKVDSIRVANGTVRALNRNSSRQATASARDADDRKEVRLQDHMKWLAGLLGGLRDLDVLYERLWGNLSLWKIQDQSAAERLLARVEEERELARHRISEAFRSAQFGVLVLLLGDFDRFLPTDVSIPRKRLKRSLRKSCTRAWRRVRRDVKRLQRGATSDELHRLRLVVKRARYTFDFASAVVGAPAKTHASKLAKLQGILGEHQDASMEISWLERFTQEGGDPAAAELAKQLILAQREVQVTQRKKWKRVWGEASEKKLVDWLS